MNDVIPTLKSIFPSGMPEAPIPDDKPSGGSGKSPPVDPSRKPDDDGGMERRLNEVEKAIIRIDSTLDRLIDKTGKIESTVGEYKGEVKALKSTIIVTGISTVVAIVFGVAAFNATVLSNMVASFESGKNTTSALDAVAARVERVQAAIEAAQAAKLAQPAAPTRTATPKPRTP